MHRIASLDNAVLNLNALRDDCRLELLDLLSSLTGKKCLILDQALGSLLSYVIPEGPKILREKGVTFFRELKSSDHGGFKTAQREVDLPDHIIYLVRPNIKNTKAIATNIKTGFSYGVPDDFIYKIYFVPKPSLLCQKILQELGVLSRTEIEGFPLDLIPLDTDLLSLELDDESGAALLCPTVSFNWACDGGSAVMTVAQSLVKLQTVYGTIPNVKAIGQSSAAALRMCMRYRKEEWDPKESALLSGAIQPEIDTLIMIDRSVDLVTPLVTPLTYEGLIDELIGISNGFIKLDAAIFGESEGEAISQGARQVAVPLNSGDSLYKATRDLSVELLGPYLQEKAKGIRESYATFRQNKDQSITEIQQFVKKIPGLNQMYKSLNQHIHIAESVKKITDDAPFMERWQCERSILDGELCLEFVETLIYRKEKLYVVLRLLCLQSVTKGGIPSSKFDSIRRDLVHAYGFSAVNALGVLESAGLLKRSGLVWVVDAGGVGSWGSLRRILNLVADVDPNNIMKEMNYVCGGYAPLSARLIQAICHWGTFDLAAAVRSLPGPYIDLRQEKIPMDLNTAITSSQAAAKLQEAAAKGGSKKVMVVYFVGGVTFTEIAALRHLNGQPDFPYHVVVATTKLSNGTKFLKQLCKKFRDGLRLE